MPKASVVLKCSVGGRNPGIKPTKLETKIIEKTATKNEKYLGPSFSPITALHCFKIKSPVSSIIFLKVKPLSGIAIFETFLSLRL